jgi:hypothetical protein
MMHSIACRSADYDERAADAFTVGSRRCADAKWMAFDNARMAAIDLDWSVGWDGIPLFHPVI